MQSRIRHGLLRPDECRTLLCSIVFGSYVLIIAIDGPAGSGKSTTARLVAQRLGFRYIDTGAMYRAAALALLHAGVNIEGPLSELEPVLDEIRIDLDGSPDEATVVLDGNDVSYDIRRPQVGAVVSDVAAKPEVRRKLVAEQRRIAHEFVDEGEGVVLDGRDIGTYVFPDAELKIYMVADLKTRAARRVAELVEQGHATSEEEVMAEIERRDAIDSSRSFAPLRPADDAVKIDTTAVSVDEQVATVERLARERSTVGTVRN